MIDVDRAMVLAAGLGQRMRPLTLTRPKPLVNVGGKALIDYALDRLRVAGVKRVVINVHYLAEQVEAWAKGIVSPDIVLSDERAEILDTGGGIRNALPLLGNNPFYVLNSDSFWMENETPALLRLSQAWDQNTMDCLLLLCPVGRTVGYDGKGDFIRRADGRLERRARAPGEAFAYIGGYLVHPRLFEKASAGKFSMNVLWDEAIAEGRLHGVIHDGIWLHVGTPDAVALAEAALAGT